VNYLLSFKTVKHSHHGTQQRSCYSHQTREYINSEAHVYNMQNNTYLSKLPVDLLRNVVEQMPVEDVMNLKTWAQTNGEDFNAIVQECNYRMSVLRYVDRVLGNGSKWLDAMSKCACYISGSRSLEFFVPGSVTDSSDLDIYTRMGKGTMQFMNLTNHLGVEWFHVLDVAIRQIKRGDSDIVLNGDRLRSVIRSGELEDLCTRRSCEFECDRYIWFDDFLTMRVRGNKVSVVKSDECTGYEASNIRDITYGELSRNNVTIPIQLIHETRASGELSVDAIFNFHSSCVQSFIGPHGACHLYGRLTASKSSYYWDRNVKRGIRPITVIDDEECVLSRLMGHLSPEWSKYEDRGFTYSTPKLLGKGTTVRQVGDSECTTLYYSDHTEAPSSVVSMYQRHMKLIQWSYLKSQRVNQVNNTKPTHISEGIRKLDWFRGTYS
jgi:hypothetical protein